MKKYEYVRIIGNCMVGAKYKEHQNVINRYALNGFTYVGYIPVNIAENGKVKEIDLIFEIDC